MHLKSRNRNDFHLFDAASLPLSLTLRLRTRLVGGSGEVEPDGKLDAKLLDEVVGEGNKLKPLVIRQVVTTLVLSVFVLFALYIVTVTCSFISLYIQTKTFFEVTIE